MNVVLVPKREKFLLDLLQKAQDEGLILETEDGKRYALVLLEGWEGFEVGESEDFQAEVEATAQNEELLRLLAGRRKEGERLPIEDVRKTLGVD